MPTLHPCPPPFVVLRIVPSYPTTHPVESLTNCIVLRSLFVPEYKESQVSPPFVVRKMYPASADIHPVFALMKSAEYMESPGVRYVSGVQEIPASVVLKYIPQHPDTHPVLLLIKNMEKKGFGIPTDKESQV